MIDVARPGEISCGVSVSVPFTGTTLLEKRPPCRVTVVALSTYHSSVIDSPALMRVRSAPNLIKGSMHDDEDDDDDDDDAVVTLIASDTS